MDTQKFHSIQQKFQYQSSRQNSISSDSHYSVNTMDSNTMNDQNKPSVPPKSHSLNYNMSNSPALSVSSINSIGSNLAANNGGSSARLARLRERMNNNNNTSNNLANFNNSEPARESHQQQEMNYQYQNENNEGGMVEFLKKELKEAQYRLKARDDYLQNTILNTAKKIAELDLKVTELQTEKDESDEDLMRLMQENSMLIDKISTLEQENLDLQIQYSEQSESMMLSHEVDGHQMVETEEEVIVRDMPTQTEPTDEHIEFAFRRPSSICSDSVAEMSISMDRNLLSQWNHESRVYELTKLQVSTLQAIIVAKDETLQEFQDQLEKLDIDNNSNVSENVALREKVMNLKAQLLSRNSVIESLISRVDSLENLLSTCLIKKATNPTLNKVSFNPLGLNSPISPSAGGTGSPFQWPSL